MVLSEDVSPHLYLELTAKSDTHQLVLTGSAMVGESLQHLTEMADLENHLMRVDSVETEIIVINYVSLQYILTTNSLQTITIVFFK